MFPYYGDKIRRCNGCEFCSVVFQGGIPISHFLPGHKSSDIYMEIPDENVKPSSTETTPIDKQDTPTTDDVTQNPRVRERLASMGLRTLLKMVRV